MKLKRLCTVSITLLVLVANSLWARELTQGEWYLRLVLTAETDALEDPYNTLGQLTNALPGYDVDDLPELGQPFAGTYLSVIFYRPDWETEQDTYNTDYHPISYIGPTAGCDPQPGTEAGDEWAFEVRSDDPARDLSLTWEGSEGANLERMVLIDLEENITVPAVVDGVIQEYTFRMNGAVREFTWALLSDQQYDAFVSKGQMNPSEVLHTSNDLVSYGTEAGTRAGASTIDYPSVRPRAKSNWLPRGWSPGEADSGIPDDLPDNPLSQ